MNKNLRLGHTVLGGLMAFGLIACTTSEAAQDGATAPADTATAISGLGTLCAPPAQVLTDFTSVLTDAGTAPTDPRFGTSGYLQGGLSFYPSTLKSDLSQNSWHITGTVDNYAGFGLYFDNCDRVDASQFKGIQFTVSGTVSGAMTFGVGTAGNTASGAWMLANGKTAAKTTDVGRCTPTSDTNNIYYTPGCTPSSTTFTVPAVPAAQSVAWTSLTGGAPEASVNPKEITSVYWAFAWQDKGTPYAIDFTLDDIKFIP